MYLPEEVMWDWQKYPNYTGIGMAVYGLYHACKVMHDQLAPFVDVENVYKGAHIFFTPTTDHPDLKANNALGLSYLKKPIKNLNYFPMTTSTYDATIYSSVSSMELAHGLWYVLTGNSRECNDVIHWLYNENHLIITEFDHYGTSIKIVVPDLAYGWKNREQIMSDIKSGKAEAGSNPYWSSPAHTGQQNIVRAELHEIEHIKNFLIYGNVHGYQP